MEYFCDHYPFVLPPLPYAYDALAPQLGSRLLRMHHDDGFGGHVARLNELLRPYPALHALSAAQLARPQAATPVSLREPLREEAGAVFAHTLYFESLGAARTPPSAALFGAIRRDFGSLHALRRALLSQASGGFVWLCVDRRRALRVIHTSAHALPEETALLCFDQWEHAYVLQYETRRREYLRALWQVVDWEGASVRFDCACARQPRYPVDD